LSTLSLLLELAPTSTFPEVERDLLNDIYNITHSHLISGVALESLFRFYSSLVQADNQIATHVVPNLVISADKAPKAESNPANVAKCIAQVVRSQPDVAAGTIAEYLKYLKSSKAKPSLVILSLLIIGELGRFMFVPFITAMLLISKKGLSQ
jgi:cullin-associated NEDD8-dissociated protein 1